MKRIALYAAAAGLLGLCSCSSDAPENIINPDAEGEFYTTLSLKLPKGTRSATTEPGEGSTSSSDAGNEVGKSYENNVNNVLVVIASRSNDGQFNYITHSISNAKVDANNDVQPTYNVKFKNAEIVNQAGNQIYVFAYCNPTAELADFFDNNPTTFVDQIAHLANDNADTFWKKENFVMANDIINAPITLPSQKEMGANYGKPTNPMDLGVVSVERVAARFDFQETRYEGMDENNVYPIRDESLNEIARVKVIGLSLFNEANEFYYLPRVSNDGTSQGWEICGRETPANWVVSPNWTLKNDLNETNYSSISGKYFFNMTTMPKDYTYTALADLTEEDNNEGWTSANTNYHIWRYCTENTIPTISAQKRGITTGVLFKTQLLPGADATIAAALATGEPVYAYDGNLLGTAADVYAYVQKNPLSNEAKAFNTAFTVNNGKVTANFTSNADAASAGYKVFVPENGNYYMYYYYYNRHNNNGNDQDMGRMEFDVVRNNVYKLSVSNFYRLGHPGDDPDNPNEDDEVPEVYFKVAVKVLPWVVRINDFDF